MRLKKGEGIMRAGKYLMGFLGIFFLCVLVGCTRVRTYTVEKDRVDQNLAGNQGYTKGQPSAAELQAVGARKLTRKTYVAEIELGSAQAKIQPAMTAEAVSEPVDESVIQEEAPQVKGEQTETQKVSTYIVGPNDTLQKISLKVFGTSKKWKKIFEANSDQLKSPDRIFVGQVLKIPQE